MHFSGRNRSPTAQEYAYLWATAVRLHRHSLQRVNHTRGPVNARNHRSRASRSASVARKIHGPSPKTRTNAKDCRNPTGWSSDPGLCCVTLIGAIHKTELRDAMPSACKRHAGYPKRGIITVAATVPTNRLFRGQNVMFVSLGAILSATRPVLSPELRHPSARKSRCRLACRVHEEVWDEPTAQPEEDGSSVNRCNEETDD
jgi:hypothetical protein